MPSRAYRKRTEPAGDTRERIVRAVRELLGEGAFHEAPVETVAARAGVSRATLYQHFGSRLGLVDALCDTFDANPALVALRETTDVESFIRHCVEFWASEEPILVQLYGVAAADPAAGDLVERQTRDRYSELRRVLHLLGLGEERLPALGALTSFETYLELRRRAGLDRERVAQTLCAWARALVE